MLVKVIYDNANDPWFSNIPIISLYRLNVVLDFNLVAFLLDFDPVGFLNFNLEGSWSIA